MSSRYRIVALTVAVAALAACGSNDQGPASDTAANTPTAAQSTALAATGSVPIMVTTPMPSRLDWNSLSSQVGKYQNQIDLFEHGPISVALKQLLGDSFPVLQRNLQVAGPLRKDGQVFYLTGNAPHQGGQNQAYLLIDPSQKALEVGLWQNGELSTWATPDTRISKPADVQRMIDNATRMPTGAVQGEPAPAATR